MNHRAKYLGER